MDERTGGETATELRRSLSETAESASQLDAERYALEEIRDDLEAKERDLSLQLSSAMSATAELTSEVATERNALGKIEGELEAVLLESAALQRQCASRELQLNTLDREASALNRELGSVRTDVSSAGTALTGIHESVCRIDRKLVFTEKKHTASRPPKTND